MALNHLLCQLEVDALIGATPDHPLDTSEVNQVEDYGCKARHREDHAQLAILGRTHEVSHQERVREPEREDERAHHRVEDRVPSELRTYLDSKARAVSYTPSAALGRP